MKPEKPPERLWWFYRFVEFNYIAPTKSYLLKGKFNYTFEESVLAARRFPDAKIIPLHFEGWSHFSESQGDIEAVELLRNSFFIFTGLLQILKPRFRSIKNKITPNCVNSFQENLKSPRDFMFVEDLIPNKKRTP